MQQRSDIGRALPEVVPSHSPASWIHTRSVCGRFGITAEVADFGEVLDWQEKRRALTQGYFRLIHPPKVQEFKARLEARYPGFKAVLYTSARLAMKEWIEAEGTRGRHALQWYSSGADWVEALPDQHAGLPLLRLEEPADADVCCAVGLPTPEELGDAVWILGLSDPLRGARAGVLLTKDASFADVLHERNRRRGGSLSSRDVHALLGDDPDPDGGGAGDDAGVLHTLKTLEGAESAFLYPSGMEAVTVALDLVLPMGASRVIVMGHVYRDTHLILEEQTWCGRSLQAEFLRTHDLQGLKEALADSGVAAVLLETITNPLIEVPDLPAIVEAAHAAGVPVLVDSTMATPFNCRPLHWGADLVIHSTSKYLSGGNQHGGGAILTRDAQWTERLQADRSRWDHGLSPLEIPPLRAGLATFEHRMARFNRNGNGLADFLRQHPAVSRVYHGESGKHPWLTDLGSVVSFVLKDERQEAVARFFDSPMPGIHKAPSLGSDVTLFCPYVLLAYYDKSEAYLTSHGIPRHLLRIAAGCEEDFSQVLRSIDEALSASKW